uniref:Uncharacterized protein n=1 Tax=Bursaphelenchus xylophilus TaxID=6326 RepID=A0A1I7S8F5_BURXY
MAFSTLIPQLLSPTTKTSKTKTLAFSFILIYLLKAGSQDIAERNLVLHLSKRWLSENFSEISTVASSTTAFSTTPPPLRLITPPPPMCNYLQENRSCTPPKVSLYRCRKVAVSEEDKTPLANQSFNLSSETSSHTGSLSTYIGESEKPQNRISPQGHAPQKKTSVNVNDLHQDSMNTSFASSIGRCEQESTEFKFTLSGPMKSVQAPWKTSKTGKRRMNRMREMMSLNDTFNGGSCSGFFKEHDSGFKEPEPKFERDLLADVPPNAKYYKGKPAHCALHNVTRKYLIKTFPGHVDIMTLIRNVN